MNRNDALLAILSAIVIVILTGIATYFGRIYFPRNFQPETTHFLDNWWVLTFAVTAIIAFVTLAIYSIWFCIAAIITAIRDLIYYIRNVFR